MNKWVWIGLGIAAFVAFLAWLFIESSKPLPGEKMADLGRKHVPAGTKVDYNSNPPTSGDHYADWVRSGVYESPKEDGYLVHSLEHGYVIMSYKCSVSQSISESVGQIKSEATQSAKQNEECRDRQNQLRQVYDKKGQRKLIVVPRENLDTSFALTAWTYLDKFDQFDQSRIEKFIDTHLNQGPEKTME